MFMASDLDIVQFTKILFYRYDIEVDNYTIYQDSVILFPNMLLTLTAVHTSLPSRLPLPSDKADSTGKIFYIQLIIKY